jgi:hypothetical protein
LFVNGIAPDRFVCDQQSFPDEIEAANAEELMRQRDRSTREFREGLTVSWEQVKLNNGL